ncbi:MAG: hypothetical protein KJ906_00270 [Nanoarchaeota archaeon]|nr:hypothetical protein [Nanoarchaeota archaeon]
MKGVTWKSLMAGIIVVLVVILVSVGFTGEVSALDIPGLLGIRPDIDGGPGTGGQDGQGGGGDLEVTNFVDYIKDTVDPTISDYGCAIAKNIYDDMILYGDYDGDFTKAGSRKMGLGKYEDGYYCVNEPGGGKSRKQCLIGYYELKTVAGPPNDIECATCDLLNEVCINKNFNLLKVGDHNFCGVWQGKTKNYDGTEKNVIFANERRYINGILTIEDESHNSGSQTCAHPDNNWVGNDECSNEDDEDCLNDRLMKEPKDKSEYKYCNVNFANGVVPNSGTQKEGSRWTDSEKCIIKNNDNFPPIFGNHYIVTIDRDTGYSGYRIYYQSFLENYDIGTASLTTLSDNINNKKFSYRDNYAGLFIQDMRKIIDINFTAEADFTLEAFKIAIDAGNIYSTDASYGVTIETSCFQENIYSCFPQRPVTGTGPYWAMGETTIETPYKIIPHNMISNEKIYKDKEYRMIVTNYIYRTEDTGVATRDGFGNDIYAKERLIIISKIIPPIPPETGNGGSLLS